MLLSTGESRQGIFEGIGGQIKIEPGESGWSSRPLAGCIPLTRTSPETSFGSSEPRRRPMQTY
jgi:hypothetical protein